MHLTETEIQEYVLGEAGALLTAHVEGCEDCKAAVAAYEVLFAGIKELPEAGFDFDVRELVLAELASSGLGQVTSSELAGDAAVSHEYAEEAVKRGGYAGMLATLTGILCFSALLYFFRAYLASLFTGISPLLLYFIIISVSTILIFLLADMYKGYQRKMTSLEQY